MFERNLFYGRYIQYEYQRHMALLRSGRRTGPPPSHPMFHFAAWMASIGAGPYSHVTCADEFLGTRSMRSIARSRIVGGSGERGSRLSAPLRRVRTLVGLSAPLRRARTIQPPGRQCQRRRRPGQCRQQQQRQVVVLVGMLLITSTSSPTTSS